VTERLGKSPWLPFGTAPDAGIRLLCLPHAGAGATVYRAWGAGFPAHIGVCPVQPPGREKRRREQPLTAVTELAALLRRLGGTPEEVLRDESLLRAWQPLLTADFMMNEGYEYRPEPPLAVPVTVFAATRDTGTDLAQAVAWQKQTSAGFQLCQLDGGHFAVFDRAPQVRDEIVGTLRRRS